MYLEIITPDKILFTGEIKIARLPGILGSFEVMKNHVPILSILSRGKIRVRQVNDVISYFLIQGGIVEFSNNKVKVLVNE